MTATTATELNNDTVTYSDTSITTETTHAIDNVQTNKINNKNNYNSGLDTSNSVTTNSIGKINTSQTSNTTTTNNETTTVNTNNTNAKTIQKVNEKGSVKEVAYAYPTTWYEFTNAIYNNRNQDELIITLEENGIYYINAKNGYTLSSSYMLRNVTIIGNNATFNGQNNNQFLKIGSYSGTAPFMVNITNTNFVNCGRETDCTGGVISSNFKTMLYITNCTFINSTARNGGVISFEPNIETERSYISLNNSKFINSYAVNHAGVANLKRTDLSIDNCEFINTTSFNIAGTIFMNSGQLNVTNTIFNDSKSKGNRLYSAGGDPSDFSGSALHICSLADANIINNTFVNNYAAEGGAIAFHRGGTSAAYGTIVIANNSFLNNSAAHGAAITSYVIGDFVIENNTFINNTAFGRNDTETAVGGAIEVRSGIDLTISNNIFENNTAYKGGAIHVAGRLTSINNTFTGNNATLGGAISTEGFSASFSGMKDIYINNTAEKGGVAYISDSAIVSSSNGIFGDNNATLGGVFYVERNAMFETNYDTFENNTATRGGVLYINNTSRAVEAKGSNYTNNKATEHGGVVYVEEGLLDSEDETYANNSALIGGAVYNHNGTIDSINNKLINNTALYGGAAFNSENATMIKKSGTDINNTALIGGAIYNNGTFESTGSNLENNNATIGGALFNNGNATVTRDTFKNNNATLGGALYNNASFTTTSNTFIGNNATNGGAILDNGTLRGTGNNYYNNTALENGGAVYTCENNTITIERLTLEGNTAGQNGGAIYTENNVVINSSHDVKYVNNTAVNGGAVYLGNSSNISTSSDEFIGNNATNGGAIYASANNTLVVKTKTTFDSNNATNGAAIYLNDSSILNSNNAVYKNGNATNGSAIYAFKGSQIITNGNEFINNNATNGAIYLDEEVNVTLVGGVYANNTAEKGAAIYTKSDLNTTNLVFNDNTAENGGAIYLDGVTYNSKQDTFTSNNATSGGAIYVNENSVANLSSTFTSNNATDGGAVYLEGTSVVNTTGSTYSKNQAENGGVYYVSEESELNVLGNDVYNTNKATNGAVFYNNGNINSTNNQYTKGTAQNGGVLYNVEGANFASTNDEFTSNNAVDGAVIYNDGNVTLNESTINSNTGTNSVILNNKYLTLINNTVSNNIVTSDEGAVITNNVVTATIVDNLFVSNTDLKRDMLLAAVQPESITGNVYIDNYLNDTIDVPGIIEIPLDVLEYYVNVTLNLSNIYNDTVRNGTVYFYDENINSIGEGAVVDGKASVRIYRPYITKGITNATVVYRSLSNHYQDMTTKTEIHLGKATRIRFDPINQTYVDDKVNVTVRLFEVENSTPMYDANITVYINGVEYTGNTTDKGYITIPDISFSRTGNYPMNATFKGNVTHENSTVSGVIEVIKVPTHLTLALPTNVTHPDDEGYINVTLYDSRDNSTIRAFNVTLNVTGKTGYVAVPDENGNITYLFTAYDNGHIQVVASVHESNDKYKIPAEVNGELFIERYHTHFHSNNTAILTDGNPTNVTFTLYDPDHNLIKNKNITITIVENGEVVTTKNVKTDENGVYVESYVINTNDDVTITAFCTEDYKYRNSSLPVHLIAGKNSTWVALSPENTYVNKSTTIRINLEENGDHPFTGKINLTVGDYDPVEVEVTNGLIYYTNSSMTWPERMYVTVMASYLGDENHTDTSATATFTVFRAGTNTTVEVLENLDTKTVIAGNVTSEGYPPINIGNVTLTASYTNVSTGIREYLELGNATVIDGKYNLTTNKLEVLESDYGRYVIEAKYNANNVFYESSADTGTVRITSFRNTTIRIINNPSTRVGQEEDIIFALYDSRNESLVNKTLTITINGTNYTDINLTTDYRGYVVVHTSFDKVAVNNISARFEGDDYYNSSSNTGNITVKQRTITTITVPSPVHVYDNITVNVTLTDIGGNPLANQSIIVNDHEHQDTFITDENGTVLIDVAYTTYGTKNVTAGYIGSLFYMKSNSTDIIQVLRLDTILNVTAESPVIIGNVTKLDGYLVLHNGTPIANQKVNMYINNATVPIQLTTDENGYYSYNYTTTQVGRNNVRVVFDTNDVYWGFEDSQAFIVKKYITDISVQADRLIKVDERTTIKGILEDEFGNKLANKIVNLTVNGEVIAHDYTSDDGSYEFIFSQPKDGIYNIIVNFTGDNKYMKCFDTYQIKVEKIITHINITGISPVNYGDRIVVDGILFDEYGNRLSRENITVYINGTEIFNTSTRGVGDVNYTYTADTIGLQNITFRYNGTDKYYTSNNTFQVNVIKLYSHFDNLEATNVELGDNTTVTGYLIDESGRGLKNTEFNATLNDDESTTITVKTDNYGYFSFEFNSTVIGINNITLSYPGNYSQEPVDDYVTFTVDKLDVFIDANVTNLKAGNTTVFINVTDEEGNPIPEGTVIIYYDEDGEPIGNGTVDENGTVEISLPLEPGVQDIIIVYNGTEELYKYARTTLTIDVPLYKLNLTINKINDTKVRNSTNITGYLFYEDLEENPIVGENLTIIVDGIEIANVTTGEDGNYSCQYNATTSGFKEVLVIFNGNETHSRVEATGNFTVEKINTKINITKIENTTVDNIVIINGTLVDEFDIIIPNAPVTIEINGVNYTNTTGTDGKYYYEFPTSVIGENNITVYYGGNNTFNATVNSTTFNVTKHPTNVTANITNPRPGNNLITIKVTDENNNNVTTGNVIIKEGETELGTGIIVNGELVTAIVLTPGEHTLTIEYEGMPKYAANQTTYTVEIPKINTTIIPESVNAVKFNNTIFVNGTLVDEFNRPVGPTNINISINGINVTVPVDEEGKFSYENTTNVTGINNVTIVYDGNDTYTNSSVSFNFTVSPLFTQITANATSPVVITNNTIISGVLSDENGNSIADADVEIWINGALNETVTTDGEGKYSYEVSADTLGLNNVSVIYRGNSTYTAVNTTTNYYVDKMFTAVNITTVSPVKVGSNTTISGRLVDGRGSPIKDAVINITVGDSDKYNATTDADGYYTLDVTGTNVGEYKVKVFYNGSEVYIESNNTGKFIVELYNSNVAVNNTEVVNGKTNITVNVTDEFDNPIPGGFVNITENGVVIGNGTINENGTLITNVTLTPGRHNITVEYNGTANSTPANATIIIDVPKYDAKLSLELINDTIVRNTTNITGFLLDENDNPVSGAELAVVVNDIVIANVVTGEDGNYSVVYNATSVGDKSVVVKFAGDETYAPLDVEGTFNVGPIHTNVTVPTIENTTIGGVVTINGTLTDELGLNVSNVEVIITVNGKNYTTNTDENGVYSYDYTTGTAGINNITVTFVGDNNIIGTVNTTTFNVTKIKTTTTADIIAVADGTSLIEVNVTDEFGENVTDGPVRVLDGTDVVATGRIINGTAVIPVPTEAGKEYQFTVTYDGTDIYENSTTSTAAKVIPKLNTTIIPENVNAVKINDTIKVNGKLVDQNNIPVGPTQINISINGINVTVPVDEEGKFSYENTTNVTGINNVTIVYDGNDTYTNSSVSFNFTVSPLSAQITANAISPIVITNNTTISGVLKDEKGNNIAGADVEIWINGKLNNTVQTLDDGTYSYELPTDTLGLNNVSVIYRGNDTYTAVNTTTNYYVDKMFTAVNITTVSPVKVGSNTTISGRLVDGRGSPIKDAVINITVGDSDKYNATTDADGYYTLNVTGTEVGDFKVKVFYNGSEVFIESNNTGKFIVEQHDSNIQVEILELKAGNSTLNITLTDESGNPIPDGFVNITNSTGDVIGNGTIVDGQLVTNITVEPGKHNVTIVYNGTNEYVPTNKTISLNVPEHQTEITVELPVSNTEVRSSTNINGTLKDPNGEGIKDANVTIIVDGHKYNATTDENGTYSLQYNATTAGEKTVIIEYIDETGIYSDAGTEATFRVDSIDTKIDIEPIDDNKVGYVVNINGTLKDYKDRIIPFAEVIISVNGVNHTVTTDENGEYALNYTANTVGQNNVTVIFDGTNNFNGNQTNTTFMISTHDTKTTASVTDNDTGASVIEVTVTDVEGNNVPNGPVIIKDLEGNEITTGNIVNGTLTTVIPTKVGDNNYTIIYDGTNKYTNSSYPLNFKIDEYEVSIIPDALPVVKVGEEINITGTILDENNKPVANQEINVTINGQNFTVTTDEKGNYIQNYTVNTTGVNNVTITLPANENYTQQTTSYNFTVNQIFTYLNATATSPVLVSNNTTISGVLTDEYGEVIADANVLIYINDVNVKNTTTGTNGTYTFDYTGEIVGLNNVTVIYEGNNTYKPVNATTNFIVDKMFTGINITTVSPVKVGSNTTISGRLVDGRGNPIKDAVINITVGDNDKYNTTTDADGYYTLDVTGTEVGDYKVKVFYNGSEVFIESNNTGKFIVELYDSHVAVNTSDVVNGKTNITVNVTDDEGNAIPGGFVNITDENGKVIGNGTINENGTLTTNVTLTPGKHNITVVYNGTENSTPFNTTITIDVPKYDAKLTLDDINDTIVYNTTRITGKLVDENNNPIKDANLSITVNGIEITKVTTDNDGKYSVTYNATTVGEKSVVVKFAGDETYAPSEIDGTFNVDSIHTNVTVPTIEDVTIGDKVTISGTLTDELGSNVDNVEVIITVNDKNYTTNTDENGKYSYNVTAGIIGENNVTVTFIGDENIIGTVNETTFNVLKQTTNVEAEIITPKAGTSLVEVNVTDSEGNKVTDGIVEIKDGDKVIATGQIVDGTVVIPVETEAGKTYEFDVVYNGTSIYANSTGKTKQTEIPNHNLTVLPEPVVPTKVGETTNITGTIVDENNKPLANTEINVTVNGETYPVTTDENGTYTLPFTTSEAGTNNVTVSYEDEGYNKLVHEYTFPVDKLATTTSFETPSTVKIGIPSTINGTLVDENGEVVSGADITVRVGNNTIKTRTDADGKYTVKFTPTTLGANEVTVNYEGNDTYKPTMNNGVVNVDKIDTVITANDKASITIGEDNKISGILKDQYGKAIPNAEVTIKVNNKDIAKATTNSKGEYTVTFTPTTIGQNNVTVEYAGNDTYYPISNSKSFTVNKVGASINADVVDAKVGETVPITGTIVDENNKPVAGANVTISINGENHTVTTDDEGKYTYPYKVDTLGRNNVTVSLEDNDNYDVQSTSYSFNVDKLATTTTLETPKTVKVGTPTTITGVLVDENNKVVPNAKITVKVGNKVITTTTDKNGKYSVTTTPTKVGNTDITVSYAGDSKYKATNNTAVLPVDKLDTTITTNVSSPTKVGATEKITGVLLDENNKAISNANITVRVNNKNYDTTTDKNGAYSINYPTTTTGVNNVTVTYKGDDKHYSINNARKFTVEKLDVVVDVAMPNVTAGSSNLVANITDENGNKVPSGTVTITTPDGKQIKATVKDGKVNTTVPTTPGHQTYKITYDGNNNYSPSATSLTTEVPKLDTTIKVDKLTPSEVDDTTTVKGKLTDSNGKPVPNAKVTVKYADTTKVVTTDSKGEFTAEIPNIRAGTNNVTVTYNGNDTYNSASVNTTQKVNKHSVIVKVDEVSGIIGEKITLTAHVTDVKGNKVSGGNLVFKLNGKTLREDYRFDSNASPLKFKVVDGKVKVTLTADLYLRNAKNLTAAYSGSYKYEANTSAIVTAQIKKRSAILSVTTVPTTAKQDANIVFRATLTDVTKNATNKTSINTDGTVIFKVNDNTIKDESGSQIHIDVVNNVASYVYYIEPGTAGVDKNGTIRNYSVEAVYDNPSFYPDTRNSTVYNVERSVVNINFEKTTVKNNQLSVKATFTDYKGNNLVGTNLICIKINGRTYQENGKTKYFNVTNGNIDLRGIKIASGTHVKSVMVVTGDRQAYLSARESTTDITTS